MPKIKRKYCTSIIKKHIFFRQNRKVHKVNFVVLWEEIGVNLKFSPLIHKKSPIYYNLYVFWIILYKICIVKNQQIA